MSNELTFAIELPQTFKANISRKSMIFLSHVAHKELVAGEFLVAAFASHILRLFEEVEIVQNKRELCWCEEMAIKLRFRVINFHGWRWFFLYQIYGRLLLLDLLDLLISTSLLTRSNFVDIFLVATGIGTIRKLHIANGAIGWNLSMLVSTVARYFTFIIICWIIRVLKK